MRIDDRAGHLDEQWIDSFLHGLLVGLLIVNVALAFVAVWISHQ